MPLCNGTDRGLNVTPLETVADFLLVLTNEITCYLFFNMEKANEHI